MTANPSLWLDRYSGGEHEAIWTEMRSLSGQLHDDAIWPHCWAVAEETMRRVCRNVDTVIERLDATGYQFARPDDVHRPPAPNIASQLETFENRNGLLPVSLRAFYEVVGTVDLTQSTEQLVQYWPEARRQKASEIEILGEYDPLVVEVLDDPIKWPDVSGTAWFFACDEFHKANYSGGANYHVILPSDSADFPIYGMTDDSEYFVDYLRFTFQGGGFRGRSDTNEETAWKVMPDLQVTTLLADGLFSL